MMDSKKQRLMKRLDRNFAAYQASCLRMSNMELFSHAAEIAAVTGAHQYMRHEAQYSEHELDYWLAFDNPLTLAADHVIKEITSEDTIRNTFEDNVYYRMRNLVHSRKYLDGRDYALAKPPREKDAPVR
jgi:hypothetical protein